MFYFSLCYVYVDPMSLLFFVCRFRTMTILGTDTLVMIIMRKFGAFNYFDFRNLSLEVKKDVNLLFPYMVEIINPKVKIDKCHDGYYTRRTVSVCSHFKIRWHVLIFVLMRIFFFVDRGSRSNLEQIRGRSRRFLG